MQLSTEQLRGLANASQFYDAWKDVLVPLSKLPGGMYWRVINSKEYLYQYATPQSGRQQTKSLGPKTPETEAIYEDFQATKADLEARRKGIEERINEVSPTWRALRLPAIDALAGRILRAFDQMGYAGRDVTVIGTYALKAYEVEAATIFSTGMDATDDLDFTLIVGIPETAPAAPTTAPTVDARRTISPSADIPRQLLLTLKQVDSSFIVSTSSPKTVVNKNAYGVDLLICHAAADAMSKSIPWKPEWLHGQEWLQLGRQVRSVVIDFQGMPVPVFAPDPRYFALHKLWLSKQANRSATKKPKDRAQGEALLRVVQENMPHYPMDEAFASTLPAPLLAELDLFRARHPSPAGTSARNHP